MGPRPRISSKLLNKLRCWSWLSEKQRFDKNKNMDQQLSVLISRMVEELPHALSELKRNGRKSSHWAWWAWPTEKEGYSEPPPRTAVSRSTAKELLRSAPKVWEQVLCKVAELIEANGGSMDRIIPGIDWGRIHYFVKFDLFIQLVDPRFKYCFYKNS